MRKKIIKHPAALVAPKTLREALERVVENAKRSRKTTKYRTPNGNMCALGHFFTEDQIKDIIKEKCNGKVVFSLVDKFGKNNIEFMTGMSVNQANELQRINDNYGPDTIRRHLAPILKSGYGSIGFTEFKL